LDSSFVFRHSRLYPPHLLLRQARTGGEHGDSAKRIVASAEQPIIYWKPADLSYVIGFNPLQNVAPDTVAKFERAQSRAKERTVSAIRSALERRPCANRWDGRNTISPPNGS
jgi:hypothetical protein